LKVAISTVALRRKAEAYQMKWLSSALGRGCVKTQNSKSQVGNTI